MKFYIDRDKNGKIIGSYKTPQPRFDGDGNIIDFKQEEIDSDSKEYLDFINPPKTYSDLRKERYISDLGSISDQLDLIYWDSVNGTSVWEDTITQIKTDIPKP